jgi:putative spermidine/putrescine transport system ATP-binding protein
LAQRLSGNAQPFAIRPEKINMTAADELVPDGWFSVAGTVRAVTYHGATTRFAVALDGGGELAVMRQNNSSGRPAFAAGESVRLTWPRDLNQLLGVPLSSSPMSPSRSRFA